LTFKIKRFIILKKIICKKGGKGDDKKGLGDGQNNAPKLAGGSCHNWLIPFN